MNTENNSNSNLSEAELSEQKRKEAIENFINPPKKPPVKRNWLKITAWTAGSVAVIGVLVAGVVYETNKPPKPVLIPSTFDVSALKSVIGANDSVQMTFGEYVATAPPLWVEENRTMTVPVPILFNDNRIPTLSIKKIESQFVPNLLDRISIDGLEPGDMVLSLIDGEIEISQGHEKDLAVFTLLTKDAQGNDIDIMYLTSGLEIDPSIIFDKPIKDHVLIPIKKDQPIGKMLTSDKLELIGGGPLLQTFNLAVTPEEKAILLK